MPKEINIDNKQSKKVFKLLKKINLFFSPISEKLVSKHPQQDLPFDFDKLTSYINAKVPDNIKFTIPFKNTDLISSIGSFDVNNYYHWGTIPTTIFLRIFIFW